MKAIEVREGSVRGYLEEPEGPARGALVLTHGAGGNAQMPLLRVLAEAFAEAGLRVLRCDLPFRQRRAGGPPSPSAAAMDRAGLRDAAALLRRMGNGLVFLGGQSYGGRQATMLAAEDGTVADGLLLLSYPLHPPGKPQQSRTAHFPALRTRAFFVSGSKDPFGSPEELRLALRMIGERVELTIIEGAGHDLARGKFDVRKLVVDGFLRQMGLT